MAQAPLVLSESYIEAEEVAAHERLFLEVEKMRLLNGILQEKLTYWRHKNKLVVDAHPELKGDK